VLEGEFGRFLYEAELIAVTVSAMDRIVFDDVFRWLK
jgi:hypothetical protein